MMKKRLARMIAFCTWIVIVLVPAVALASEGAAGEAAGADGSVASGLAKLAAGLAMGLSAVGAGYAQAKIGSAGAGTLAERPEVAIWIITLQALPEVIVLLGFVSAILING